MAASRLPAEFRPLRPPTRKRASLLFLLGPAIWVVALVALSFVLDHGNSVEYALVILAASFLFGLAVLGRSRRVRVREESEQ